MTAVQVPPVMPAATVQNPVQQSAGEKQRSPSDEQAAPDEAHRPPWQLPEQQSEPEAQVFPTVVQPPAVSAAQVPPAQFVEQQSDPAAHACPFEMQRLAPHFPPAQTLVQHSVGCVQVEPLPRQEALVTPQVFDVGSQEPAQHPVPPTQASPGAPQLTEAPSTGRLPPAPAVPGVAPPPPPSLPDSALTFLPHPPIGVARPTTSTETQTTRNPSPAVRDNAGTRVGVFMEVRATSHSRQLTRRASYDTAGRPGARRPRASSRRAGRPRRARCHLRAGRRSIVDAGGTRLAACHRDAALLSSPGAEPGPSPT
jgi:hypothetical protein